MFARAWVRNSIASFRDTVSIQLLRDHRCNQRGNQ
jgi:hypothetical protein